MNKEIINERLEEFESEILDIIKRQLMPSAMNASSAAALQRNLKDSSSQQYQELYNSLNKSLSSFYGSFDLGKMSKSASLYYADEIKEYLNKFYEILDFSKKTTIDSIINTLSRDRNADKLLESATEAIKDRNRILGNYLYENSRLFDDYMLLWEGETDKNKYYRFTSENMDACPICCDLDKNVFRICDASIGVNMPPIHPNCLCFVDVLEENDTSPRNEPESHSSNLFDITNIVLNTPSIINWRKYMPTTGNSPVKDDYVPAATRLSNINPDIFWCQTGGWFGTGNDGSGECARTAIATMTSINSSSVVKPNDVAGRAANVTINGITHDRSEDNYGSNYNFDDFLENGMRDGFNGYIFSSIEDLMHVVNHELNNDRAVVVRTLFQRPNGNWEQHWVTVTGIDETISVPPNKLFDALMGIDPWFNGSNSNNPNETGSGDSSNDETRSGIVHLSNTLKYQDFYFDELRIFTFK
jgi:hypothetical protein